MSYPRPNISITIYPRGGLTAKGTPLASTTGIPALCSFSEKIIQRFTSDSLVQEGSVQVYIPAGTAEGTFIANDRTENILDVGARIKLPSTDVFFVTAKATERDESTGKALRVVATLGPKQPVPV